jgi:hypothetical protein
VRYLIGIFLILASLGLVVKGQNAPEPKSEEGATPTKPTQNISSKEQVEATCDYEPNAAPCAYKAAIERCGKMILDDNPVTDDPEHNDAVVTRYNECVEPYRQHGQ